MSRTHSEGDSDRLGNGSLNDFELSRGLNRISSELVIIERGLQFLVPGGRLGMVVPDGALNNSGENSYCPRFRRYILSNAKVEMIVSLPDFAFRKAGAQNKTSLLFLKKFTPDEKMTFDQTYQLYLESIQAGENPSIDQVNGAIKEGIDRISYEVFLSEVKAIGYSPSAYSDESGHWFQSMVDSSSSR